MCGLYGLASPTGCKTNPDLVVSLLSKLALLNEQRGKDATGFGIITADDTHYWKHAKTATEVVIDDPKDWRKAIHAPLYKLARSSQGWIALGHARAATSGSPKEPKNAHPFLVSATETSPEIIGAHNGVISNWQRIATDLALPKKLEVDSQVVFEGLQRAKTESHFLSQLSPVGSLALSYTIRPPKTKECPSLRLFRTSESMLSVALLPTYGLFLWSSSLLMLRGVIAGLFPQRVLVLPEDTLWTFDMATPRDHLTLGMLPKEAKARLRHNIIVATPVPPNTESPFIYQDVVCRSRYDRAGGRDYFDDGWDEWTRAEHMDRRTYRRHSEDRKLYPAIVVSIDLDNHPLTVCLNPETVTKTDGQGWKRCHVIDDKTKLVLYEADILLGIKNGVQHFRRFYRLDRYARAFDSIGQATFWAAWLRDAKLAQMQAFNRRLTDAAGWKSPYEHDIANRELQKPLLLTSGQAKDQHTFHEPRFVDKTLYGTLPGKQYVVPYVKSRCSVCDQEQWNWALIWLWGYAHCPDCYDALGLEGKDD